MRSRVWPRGPAPPRMRVVKPRPPLRIVLLGVAAGLAGVPLALALAFAARAADEPATEPPAPLRRVHPDPQRVVEHTLEAARAFLTEDAHAARAALDALTRESPPLDRDRDEGYGHEILSFDRAFHVTIDRSRESATGGDLEDAFNQFVWVQRACVTCHGMAREKGFLPARQAPGQAPSSASPADSESPNRSSATTPSR